MLQQYWIGRNAWKYVPVATFAEAFQKHKTGRRSAEDLAVPFQPTAGSKDALVNKKYSLSSKAAAESWSRLRSLICC